MAGLNPHQDLMEKLPRERERLRRCALNQAYFELRNLEFVARRPDENEADYVKRPKWAFPIVHAAISVLTAHLYNPGPVRSWPDAAANEFLQLVYEQNQINNLLQACDLQTTLNGVAAVEVHCTGNEERPVQLDLYGAEELVVWTSEENPSIPLAVATIQDDQSGPVFQLWTSETCSKYVTDKRGDVLLSGAVPNPYKRIPFEFAHNELVLRKFWGGGLGDFLRGFNAGIDAELSDLAEHARASVPVGYLKGADVSQRLIISPGFFNHLVERQFGGTVEAGYLQAQFDAPGRIAAVQERVYSTLELLGIPRSTLRLDAAALSGIAILAEQLPLLTRSKRRQPLWSEFEGRLARAILVCSMNHYELNGLARSLTGSLQTHWSEPPLPLPLPERNEDDEWLLTHGLLSQLQLTQRRFGFTREQAIHHLREVATDEELIGRSLIRSDDPPEPEEI